METYQTDPLLFCVVLVAWPLLLGLMGAWKAFFEEPMGRKMPDNRDDTRSSGGLLS